MNDKKINIWKIVDSCITVLLFCIAVLLAYLAFGRKPETGIQGNIEQLEDTTEELRTNTDEFGKTNTELARELEEGKEIIRRLTEKLENRDRQIMEILGANENISIELGENTELLRKENSEFGKDIKRLEKLYMDIMDN